MMWLSASLKIRPSAYGIAITSAPDEFARHQFACAFRPQDNAGESGGTELVHFSVKPRSFRRSRASLTASRWTIRRVGTAAVVPSRRDEAASKTYDSMPASLR